MKKKILKATLEDKYKNLAIAMQVIILLWDQDQPGLISDALDQISEVMHGDLELRQAIHPHINKVCRSLGLKLVEAKAKTKTTRPLPADHH